MGELASKTSGSIANNVLFQKIILASGRLWSVGGGEIRLVWGYKESVRPLSITILGTRGIPAAYGGFETFAEELSTRLALRGHSVCVFGRRKFFEEAAAEPYRGVARHLAPTIMHKYLETPVHALTSFLRLIFAPRCDIILLCNAANSPFAWIVKLARTPLAINVDGIESRRGKWNRLGRVWYKIGEAASSMLADVVVSDAEVIADYYREKHGVESRVIAYGADPKIRAPGEVLSRFGLEPGGYILYVSRLEPENNALGVVRAYERLATTVPLVIVGDAPYADAYKAKVRAAASSRVIFTGFQFGESYQELRSNCLFYVQATEVGGTHPALVEAMAYGNGIIANDVPEHREVLGGAGLYYNRNNFEDLSSQMNKFLNDGSLIKSFGQKAAKRAADLYTWDKIVDEYEKLFFEMAEGR